MTFTLALGSLWGGAALYGLLAVVLGPPLHGLSWLVALNGKGSPAAVESALASEWMVLVGCGAFALLNAAGALGLVLRRRWGWLLTLVVGALTVASVLLPLGIVILCAAFNADVRKACVT